MATPIPDNLASMDLERLARVCGGRLVHGAGVEFRGVVIDSRRVATGNLYVAIVGETHDGHRFCDSAAAAGAAAVLVSDPASVPEGAPAVVVDDTLVALGELAADHRRRWAGRVIAITGSAGKTTTKELVAVAMTATGARVMRTAGNLNNLVGMPMSLLTLTDAADLAVLELGTSAPGEIARLAAICQPDLAVVTTVAVAHTQGLGSLDDVADEKVSLLAALPAGATAIYNLDNAVLASRARSLPARLLSFGSDPDSDVRLVEQQIDRHGHSQCTFRIDGSERTVPFGLMGKGPALDAAAALAVVLSEAGTAGIDAAAEALAHIEPVPGRLSMLSGPAGSLILDDTYNANPESTLQSLQALTDLSRASGGRALAVLGDMRELGEASEREHRRVGRRVAELKLHMFVACGSEMATAHAEVSADGGVETACVHDAMEAEQLLRGRLAERDVLLVKGSRSMAMERLVVALQGRAA